MEKSALGKLLVAVIAVILVIGIAVGAYFIHYFISAPTVPPPLTPTSTPTPMPTPTATPTPTPMPTPTPITFYDIIVDGEIDDWQQAGLRPLATDAAYNIKSYHHISSDLLEGWACRNETCLFLAMKIRGGYSFDWENVMYCVTLDVDLDRRTGSPEGNEYLVKDGMRGFGFLYQWDPETLTWKVRWPLKTDAGQKGYIEWEVPLHLIGDPEKVRLTFLTWDNYLDETVNSATATFRCR